MTLLERLSDLQLGDEKVTLNHLVWVVFFFFLGGGVKSHLEILFFHGGFSIFPWVFSSFSMGFLLFPWVFSVDLA